MSAGRSHVTVHHDDLLKVKLDSKCQNTVSTIVFTEVSLHFPSCLSTTAREQERKELKLQCRLYIQSSHLLEDLIGRSAVA